MSRGNAGQEPKRTTRQVDRRDAQAPRVQFEALVELGSGTSGGFEAESVDVSPDGIRLRTAYLPEIGERLVCRFDGFGGEVVAEGEVIWRREQGRGGEFGLRFTGLDEHGAALLQEMCNPPVEEQPEPTAEPQAGVIGARVKLHIEGLGSPMRARVKDTARGEVLVGSSLEFLRVGRDIELEDVDHGGRRAAMIEHVGVEIDRANNVPQLVVSLRYGAGKQAEAEEIEEAPSAERYPSHPAPLQAAPPKENTPEPTVIDREAPRAEAKGAARSRPAVPPSRPLRAEVEADDEVIDGEDLSQDQPPTLATPHSRGEPAFADAARSEVEGAGKKLGQVAKSIGPVLSRASEGAKGALSSLLAAVKKKREERDEGRTPKAAKRTTAPPPAGALRTQGRRLVRQDKSEDKRASDDDTDAELEALRAAPNKRKAIAASVIGALAVIGVYVFASQVGQKGSQTDQAAVALAASASPEGAAAEPAASTNAAAQPVPGGAVATANVPLFGATPLSTTEPVPTPPNAEALGGEGEVAAGDAPAGKEGDATGGEGEAPQGDGLRKEWRVGEVHDPVALKLTMDGAVSGFTPSEGANGFTLVIPGRKSVSSPSSFKQKDKRIDDVGVVNYPDRSEVTFHFAGEAPGYAVKASGNRLVIELDGSKGSHAGGGDDEESGSTRRAKHSVKSGGHDKAKGDKAGKKHDGKSGKHTEASAKSDRKTDGKKADKKKSRK